MQKWLFTPVDNAGLVAFRMIFGLLITLEAGGAILTGWVKRVMIEPDFRFNFIGFDFLNVFEGPVMYVYFALMAVFGIMVMLGYYYRLAMSAFTLMWWTCYLMQKSAYNNHYYLLVLLCLLMCVVPAHAAYSLDARRKGARHWCYRWHIVLFIAQVTIVYTFAAVAKLNSDWLQGVPIKQWFEHKSHFWLIGPLLAQDWMPYVVAYSAILFDATVAPLMMIRRTRKIAFFAGIVFHLFNSAVFHIGIFPFMSIAFALFFFPAADVRQLFFRKQPIPEIPAADSVTPSRGAQQSVMIIMGLYLAIQVALPLRHWAIKGDVLWTEEGHRMSWRMMLRSATGNVYFQVVDKETGTKRYAYPQKYLTPKQNRSIHTKPDKIWQFAQRLKKQELEKGREVEIYAISKKSVNYGPSKTFIDPETDLAQASWNYFGHNEWVLLHEED